MANPLECRSCGHICHSQDFKCPYCGTPTSYGLSEKKTYQLSRTINNFTSNNNSGENNKASNRDSELNICLLILLVIIFWPAAIIYVFVKMSKK